MPQERLSKLIRQFAAKYQDYNDSSGSDSGALAQLWVPVQLTTGERLVTQGAPFAFIGCSDQLALYRHHAVQYQPLCSAINQFTRCPISRVYANLPPHSAAGSTDSSSSSSSSSDDGFNRCEAAHLANIHSELLLAVYDDNEVEEESEEATDAAEISSMGQKPAAVFELSLHEQDVDFTSAVQILADVARGLGYWIPQYSPSLPRKSTDFPLRSSSSSSSSAAGLTTQPAGICTSSWFDARRQPSPFGLASGQQQQQQRKQRRPSVVYTEHYKYDFARQPSSSALKSATATGNSSSSSSSSNNNTTATALAHQGSVRHVSWGAPGVQSDRQQQQQQQQQSQRMHLQQTGYNAKEQQPQQHLLSPQRYAHVGDAHLCDFEPLDQILSQVQGSSRTPHTSPPGSRAWPTPFGQQQQQPQQAQQLDRAPQQQQQQAWYASQQQQQQLPGTRISGQHSNVPTHGLHASWQQQQQQQHEHYQPHLPSYSSMQQQQLGASYHSQGDPGGLLRGPSAPPWKQQQQQQQQHHLSGGHLSGWGAATAGVAALSEPLPPLRLQSVSSVSSSGNWAAAGGDRVRALVLYGGCFKHAAKAGTLEYVGGVQKVVSITRSANCLELLGLLKSKAPPAATDFEGFKLALDAYAVQVKYALPGASGVYIDISSDDDVISMWEEWDDFCASSSQNTGATLRLQLFVGAVSSSGYSSGNSDISAGRCVPESSEPSSGSSSSICSGRRFVQRSKSCRELMPNSSTANRLLQLQSAGNSIDDTSLARAVAMLSAQVSALNGSAMGNCNRSAYAADAGTPQQSAGPFAMASRLQTAQYQGSKSCPGSPTRRGAEDEEICRRSSGTNVRSTAHSSRPWEQDMDHESPAKAAAVGQTEKTVESADAADRVSSGGCHSSAAKQKTGTDLNVIVNKLKEQVEVVQPQDLHVVRFLACGAFGDVFLAKWHGTEVAVKCLSPSLLMSSRAGSNSSAGSGGSSSSAGEKAAADLMREAAALASMRHPNIVAVYGVVLPPRNMLRHSECSTSACILEEVESPDGSGWRPDKPGSHVSGPAIVCEYMSAGSLQSAIRSKADWLKSRLVKAKVMLDTAKGLSYLHSKNMVHFDLKSGNLLYTIKDRVPTVKVADFGLSKRRHQTYVTGIDSMRGTLPWIASEIIKNPNNVTEAADVYSFGVIMWEVWTQQEPFEDAPLHSLLYQFTLHGSLSLPVPGCPEWGSEAAPPEPAPGWEELMRRCWSVNPTARPSSKQLITELEAMISALRKSKQ